jgi:hypothetical protein
MPATKVQVTEELLYKLYRGQLNHVKEFLLSESETDVKVDDYRTLTIHRPSYRERDYTFHDDSHDDLSSALELAEHLRTLYYEGDTEGLEEYLNIDTKHWTDKAIHEMPSDTKSPYIAGIPTLNAWACDGVCAELYDLDCPALPKDD